MSIKKICSVYHVSDRVIYEAIKNGTLKNRKDVIPKDYLQLTQNPELLYYLVGLVAADGCLYHDNETRHRIEISLNEVDSKVLEQISQLVFDENRVLYDKHKPRARFFLYGKLFFDLFSSYGITPRKSESLKLNYSLIPREYFHHFLRGYIDGDGTYYFKNINNVHLKIDGNYDTMISFQKLVKEFYGLNGEVYRIGSQYISFPFYRFAMQETSQAKQMINILYENATIFLQRKQKIIRQVIVPFNTEMC